jgi:hypothetical protein
MTTLTKEQLEELDLIRANPISFGAFCGMVFNNLEGHFADAIIEDEIRAALQVKVVARRMK